MQCIGQEFGRRGQARPWHGALAAGLTALLLAGCAGSSSSRYNDAPVYEPTLGGGVRAVIEAPLRGIDPSVRLSDPEVRSLSDTTARLLVTSSEEPESSWNSYGGARGLVEVGPAFLAGVQDMNGGQLRVPITLTTEFLIIPVQERVTTRVNANVRNGPGTSYNRLTTVKAGSPLNVLGKVRASDWVLVARGGEGLGYMARRLLETNEVAPFAPDAVPDDGIRDLATDPGEPSGYSDAEIDRLLAGDTARRPVLCRDVKHTVYDNGGREYRWSSTACRMRPLEWRMVDTGAGPV